MTITKIKHLTYLLLLIACVVIGAIEISKAAYQDQELIEPTISMGVLNLQVGDEDPANVILDFEGMRPEEVRTYTFLVKNTGQIEGDLTIIPLIANSGEGENPEPEPLTIFNGDIAHCARLTLSMTDINSDQQVLIDNQTIYSIHQQVYDNSPFTLVDEAVNNDGSSATVTIDAYDCGSESMGDFLNLKLMFNFLQQS